MYLVGLHIYYKMIHGPYNIKVNITQSSYRHFETIYLFYLQGSRSDRYFFPPNVGNWLQINAAKHPRRTKISHRVGRLKPHNKSRSKSSCVRAHTHAHAHTHTHTHTHTNTRPHTRSCARGILFDKETNDSNNWQLKLNVRFGTEIFQHIPVLRMVTL